MSEQERIDGLAVTALARFGLSPEATATLCNVSENHTYRVDDPQSGRRYALRVHRAGYRTAQQIESELQWVDALREDGAVDTCVPVAAPDGERVVEVSADGLGARNVALFEWLPGNEPDPAGDEVIAGFRTLGAVSARMHASLPRVDAPAGVRPPGLGLRAHARRRRALGRVAGRARHGRRGAPRCSTASTPRSPPGWRRTGRPTTASASSTPTSASPTCWQTTATSG